MRTLSELSGTFAPSAPPSSTHVWGTVTKLVPPDVIEVRLGIEEEVTRCVRGCGAVSIGDRVLVLIRPDGRCVAIATTSSSSVPPDPPADQVISVSSQGIWTVRKWASGRCELEAEKEFSVDWNGEWAGLYHHDPVSFGAYPVRFSSHPRIWITSQAISEGCMQPLVLGQTEAEAVASSPTFRTQRPTPAKGTFRAYIRVVGME